MITIELKENYRLLLMTTIKTIKHETSVLATTSLTSL